MTIKSFLKKKKEKLKKEKEEKDIKKKESKAFSDIVEKKELQIRRQSFEKEALKQAEIKGKQLAISKANKPTFGQKFSKFAQQVTPKITVRKTPVRRRRVVKGYPVRRAPVRRALVRRRRVVKKSAPQKQLSIFDRLKGGY